MVAFTNFKKLAFPSSMPDGKDREKSRGTSALDTQDQPDHYRTINSGPRDIEEESERRGTLKGRKSEEPPEKFSYKSNRIDNSNNRNENISPESYQVHHGEPESILPNSKSGGNDKPVQNIMKVGNLFMFNVYKNNEPSVTPTNMHKIVQNPQKQTPIANIELDPLDFGMNSNEIAMEGQTYLDNKLKLRMSPTSELTHHLYKAKKSTPRGVPSKAGSNFMDQMHKRIVKNSSIKTSKKGVTLASKRQKPSPRRSKKISLSNSPVNQLGKRPDVRGSNI